MTIVCQERDSTMEEHKRLVQKHRELKRIQEENMTRKVQAWDEERQKLIQAKKMAESERLVVEKTMKEIKKEREELHHRYQAQVRQGDAEHKQVETLTARVKKLEKSKMTQEKMRMIKN